MAVGRQSARAATTSKASQRREEAASIRAPASPRPTWHQAERLARRTSRCSPIKRAARPRAWRVSGVTCWPAEGTNASAASAVPVRSSSGPVHVPVKGWGPRSPDTGRAASDNCHEVASFGLREAPCSSWPTPIA